MRTLLIIIVLNLHLMLAASVDQKQLKSIENFLSTMTTLEAKMHMEILNNKNGHVTEEYDGKIWLDRKKKLMRLNYGKSFMVAKEGALTICQENAEPQTVDAGATPAGILLEPSIEFNNNGIAVNSLHEDKGVLALGISYNSPIGEIPVTLYFKLKPVMLLLGWTIQNPNNSIINVFLDPNETHMAINIKENIFDIK